MNWFDQLRAIFRTPSPEVLAAMELQEARRHLLEAQSGQEYATALVQYHSDRIARLSKIVAEGGVQ